MAVGICCRTPCRRLQSSSRGQRWAVRRETLAAPRQFGLDLQHLRARDDIELLERQLPAHPLADTLGGVDGLLPIGRGRVLFRLVLEAGRRRGHWVFGHGLYFRSILSLPRHKGFYVRQRQELLVRANTYLVAPKS